MTYIEVHEAHYEELCSKQEEAASVLKEWANKQGHERCWFYPEIFNRLCKIFEVVPDTLPCLPERSEFEQGCRRYQDEQYR